MLGDGYRCPYCGDYNADGATLCHRCGGQLIREPFLTPREFPFELRSLTIDPGVEHGRSVTGIIVRAPNVITFGFRATRELDFKKDILPLYESQGRVISLPNDYILDPGLYLCKFCGQAVRSGDDCPTCGGERFPWSELVKVDRDCIYCGTHIPQGIVCSGCNHHIGSVTLKEILEC